MIKIFRYGHRIKRDERATTHVCLAARALGADEVIISGDRDMGVIESIEKISARWGGDFKTSFCESPVSELKKLKKDNFIVQLTMYGEPIQKMEGRLRQIKDMVVIVGSQKVPPQIYNMADANIAVTNQPHSEIAALAVFLDRYFEGQELEKKFDGKVKIKPALRGKSVVTCE